MDVCSLTLIIKISFVSANPPPISMLYPVEKLDVSRGEIQFSFPFLEPWNEREQKGEGCRCGDPPWPPLAVWWSDYTACTLVQSPWEKLLSDRKWHRYSFADQHERNFRAQRAEVRVPALTGVFYAPLPLYWFGWLRPSQILLIFSIEKGWLIF